MYSAYYSQFLRLCTSKFSFSILQYPKIKHMMVSKSLKYNINSSPAEEDISMLLNTSIIMQRNNFGFSNKFLRIYISSKNFINKDRLNLEADTAWVVGYSINHHFHGCTKKYIIKSPLIQSLRKLLRKDGVDFYIDQSTVVLNLNFLGSGVKQLEIFVRFFGFPLRVISLEQKTKN